MSNRPMRHASPAPSGTKEPRSGFLNRLLLAHPRTVGETYTEHFGIAGRFGITMVLGGLKCLIHAILPAAFERAASDSVAKLHGELDRRRRAAAHVDPDYII